MLSASLKSIGREDLTDLIFTHNDSRKAARVFLDWLKGKGGRCTKEEMSQFSHILASGKLSCRLSRTNFYKTILNRLIGLGLVAEQVEYNYAKRKTESVYRAIVQPITKKKPKKEQAASK